MFSNEKTQTTGEKPKIEIKTIKNRKLREFVCDGVEQQSVPVRHF